MKIKILDKDFNIYKLASIKEIPFDKEYIFYVKTSEEISLVCDETFTPKSYIQKEEGYRCLKIEGILDFSLIGILANISNILANCEISIFVVSTFNTDYILLKKEKLKQAKIVLEEEGYVFIS